MKAVLHKVLTFICEEDIAEILIAELSLLGYNAFLVLDNGFEASIPDSTYDQDSIKELLHTLGITHLISISVKDVQEKNWNTEWERNYESVIVENYCRIKASFHRSDDTFPVEITINPKMSFGTGHHDTTYLMIKQQMGIDHRGKKVMDAGCGTGILSIFAEKLGALEITGFDIDHWAFENCMENIQINDCTKIKIIQGSIEAVMQSSAFDIILANINLHVILTDLKKYSSCLKPDGSLVLSGFHLSDFNQLHECAIKNDLFLHQKEARNEWLSLVYHKRSN